MGFLMIEEGYLLGWVIFLLDNEVPNCPVGPVVDVGSTDSNGVHPQQNLFEKVAMLNQPPV